MVTDPQTNKQTNKQGRLQCTAPQLIALCKYSALHVGRVYRVQERQHGDPITGLLYSTFANEIACMTLRDELAENLIPLLHCALAAAQCIVISMSGVCGGAWGT